MISRLYNNDIISLKQLRPYCKREKNKLLEKIRKGIHSKRCVPLYNFFKIKTRYLYI